MYQVETNTNGKQLIERLEGQNATLLYSYGFDCGTMNFNQVNLTGDVVRMHSATTQLNTSGEPVGKPMGANEWSVNIPLASCIDSSGNISMVALKDLYIDAVLAKQSPTEPII